MEHWKRLNVVFRKFEKHIVDVRNEEVVDYLIEN